MTWVERLMDSRLEEKTNRAAKRASWDELGRVGTSWDEANGFGGRLIAKNGRRSWRRPSRSGRSRRPRSFAVDEKGKKDRDAPMKQPVHDGATAPKKTKPNQTKPKKKEKEKKKRRKSTSSSDSGTSSASSSRWFSSLATSAFSSRLMASIVFTLFGSSLERDIFHFLLSLATLH